jgi:hypothetical protein
MQLVSFRQQYKVNECNHGSKYAAWNIYVCTYVGYIYIAYLCTQVDIE